MATSDDSPSCDSSRLCLCPVTERWSFAGAAGLWQRRSMVPPRRPAAEALVLAPGSKWSFLCGRRGTGSASGRRGVSGVCICGNVGVRRVSLGWSWSGCRTAADGKPTADLDVTPNMRVSSSEPTRHRFAKEGSPVCRCGSKTYQCRFAAVRRDGRQRPSRWDIGRFGGNTEVRPQARRFADSEARHRRSGDMEAVARDHLRKPANYRAKGESPDVGWPAPQGVGWRVDRPRSEGVGRAG